MCEVLQEVPFIQVAFDDHYYGDDYAVELFVMIYGNSQSGDDYNLFLNNDLFCTSIYCFPRFSRAEESNRLFGVRS